MEQKNHFELFHHPPSTHNILTITTIPCLDVTLNENGATVVKGVEFVNLRNAGDPVELAKRYNELVFLDITASHEGRGTMIDIIERTASEVCGLSSHTCAGID